MNDETLTFYYYNDGLTRAERQEVTNLIATDPDVAERYQEVLFVAPGLLPERSRVVLVSAEDDFLTYPVHQHLPRRL